MAHPGEQPGISGLSPAPATIPWGCLRSTHPSAQRHACTPHTDNSSAHTHRGIHANHPYPSRRGRCCRSGDAELGFGPRGGAGHGRHHLPHFRAHHRGSRSRRPLCVGDDDAARRNRSRGRLLELPRAALQPGRHAGRHRCLHQEQWQRTDAVLHAIRSGAGPQHRRDLYGGHRQVPDRRLLRGGCLPALVGGQGHRPRQVPLPVTGCRQFRGHRVHGRHVGQHHRDLERQRHRDQAIRRLGRQERPDQGPAWHGSGRRRQSVCRGHGQLADLGLRQEWRLPAQVGHQGFWSRAVPGRHAGHRHQ